MKRKEIISRISDILDDLESLYSHTVMLKDAIKNTDSLEFSVKYHCMSILINDQERISQCIKKLYDLYNIVDDIFQYTYQIIIHKHLFHKNKSLFDIEFERLKWVYNDFNHDISTILVFVKRAKSEVGVEYGQEYAILISLLEMTRARVILEEKQWKIDG